MKITILASGSGGNATVFEASGTRLLVDAGLGPRVLAQRLAEAGTEGLPTAIMVTHAHLDHFGHAARIAKRMRIPLYVSEATARATRLEAVPEVFIFGPRAPFSVGAFIVSPTPLPHDVAQVALRVESGGKSAAIATDLGEVPPRLADLMRDCDVLLLESNHDRAMLESGPYPLHLKRRIGSSRGHLSNLQTRELLRALPPRAHTVVLMHLSETNNRPELALESARDALAGRRVRLLAASQTGTLVIDAAAPPPALGIAGRGHRMAPCQLELPLG